MSFKRKLRKLVRNPKLFWADMLIKKNRKISNLMPKKMEGHDSYTIVSAVYNVSLYLDDFFKSLVDQRLDFTHNIYVVLVDDGSTDNSAEIIKKWQAKYPKNISYFYKENGGQASARNFGIPLVKTRWVTFVDPDDTLDLNYFLEIDKFINAHATKDLKLVNANLFFHFEESGEISNTHPLKYKFAKGDKVFLFSDLEKHMQLAVNSAFFRSDILLDKNIIFDELIRPNFEDAHFVGSYLAVLNAGTVGFSSKAIYYYRKRKEQNSTLDTAWTQVGLFDIVLRNGCLGLLENFLEKQGQVPVHIQRTVLYHLAWYFKRIINHPGKVDFLQSEQKENFLNLLNDIFFHIDAKVILDFELAGLWFLHKVGILGLIKQSEPDFQIVYIDQYDSHSQQLLLRYFTYDLKCEYITIDGIDKIPTYTKTVKYDFLSHKFVLERRIWIYFPIHTNDTILDIKISNIPTRISFNAKQHHKGISTHSILKYFKIKPNQSTHCIHENDLWLFMDRDTQADDNAEHLYRYVKNNIPTQPIVFILQNDSHDWMRLEQEGFNLVAYGSAEHESVLKLCKKIISSHADQYVVNYFEDGSLVSKQFVFLQHGVTHNDISTWLNSKQIACFVTSALPEYQAISDDETHYKFGKKEVVLTGFPRHDNLLLKHIEQEPIILIMPTWRKFDLGTATNGNMRSYNERFMETQYAKCWQSVLCSSRLKQLANLYNHKIVFFPHANIQPYLEQFALPEYIEIMTHNAGSIQLLFQRAALLITDYSSVAFEIAYLQKPILYYQFDEAIFFQGDHIHQRGYFDYRQHGFGTVAVTETSLLNDLEELLKNNNKIPLIYLDRMKNFFAFRDGRCCERVVNAIFKLDQVYASETIDLAILKNAAEMASQEHIFPLAEKRWNQFCKLKYISTRCINYTIVSAVYNVSLYLDDFFKSLVDQRLDFTHNIYVVLVDDGSTDNSAEIIKKWQAKYPKNISYFYKENGGQASARNFGIPLVKTRWVTFVDPDDTLDLNYFLEIDKFINAHATKDLKLVNANLFFHFEESGEISNTHPLKYKFAKGDKVFLFSDLEKHMQLAVNSAFFRSDILLDKNIIFDELIRPNFEDAHFVGSYLAVLNAGTVGFSSKAIYYYRKRKEQNSTLDTAWTQVGLFDIVLRNGCLGLLENFLEKQGQVPVHIQRTVLYHLAWYFKRIINHPGKVDFLQSEQKENFLNLLNDIFFHIDAKVILDFELAGLWFLHKVGILGLIKQSEPDFQIVYIDQYDSHSQQLLLRYFTYDLKCEYITIDGIDKIPTYTKTVKYDFLSHKFVLERRIWIYFPIHTNDTILDIKISNIPTRISFNAKQHHKGISTHSILKYFKIKPNQSTHCIHENDLWLFMDRDTQADDNAEHLYRYVKNNIPTQPIVFILQNDSHDWMRLEQEGFNLVAYGSAEHESVLKLCKKIISSHADQYVVNYFEDGSLVSKQFVFLQHGVTHNDISTWLNSKQIACFVTSALPEYQAISDDETHYKFGKKEVVLTGFPRHDNLLLKHIEQEPIILIMPTWRKFDLGTATNGNMRSYNERFMETQYAKCWQSVLCSSRLKQLANLYNHKIVFFPHANIQPYLEQFALPEYIEIMTHNAGSIQLLFQRAALLITDYSSVAFEIAYLQKPILYYQFDEAIFFQGDHIHQRGYFDYRQHGFGTVAVTETSLLNDLEELLKNNNKIPLIYLDRMKNFFAFRDGRCCERVVNAIFKLDQVYASETIDLAILKNAAEMASQEHIFPLAEKRWNQYLVLSNTHCKTYDKKNSLLDYNHQQLFNNIVLNEKNNMSLPFEILQAKFNRVIGDFQKTNAFLDSYQKINGKTLLWYLESARLASDLGQSEKSLDFYNKVLYYDFAYIDKQDYVNAASHARKIGNLSTAIKFLQNVLPDIVTENSYNKEWGEIYMQLQLWDHAEIYWRKVLSTDSDCEAMEKLIFCLNEQKNHCATELVRLTYENGYKKDDL